MNFKELQEIFNSKNIIIFKLYSLEYIIEKEEDYIVAYATNFYERKQKYNSFKEAINTFKIYNEPLISQIDNIELIEKDDQ